MNSPIDRLTALDQFMLQVSARWPQDIGALALLDGTNLLEPSGRFRIEAALETVGSRLHLVPRFRQVVHVPRRGLGAPLWVDTPPRSTSASTVGFIGFPPAAAKRNSSPPSSECEAGRWTHHARCGRCGS
jgi:hypothetical protein